LFNVAPFLYTRDWWEQYVDSPEAYDRWRKNWGETYFDVQDARDLYYRTRSFGEGWVGNTPGFKDLNSALAAINARTLFIYNPRDSMSTPEQVAAQVKAIAGARSIAIDSPAGHLVCCHGDPNATQALDRTLKEFLSELDPGRTAAK
jgi:pimeloyl-ACP methyl ester carboxylesterase